jgi:hypothetical protein
MEQDEKKKKGLLSKLKGLFPASQEIQEMDRSAGMLELSQALASLAQNVDLIEQEVKNSLVQYIPQDRLAQYTEFDKMEQDPICGGALHMHVSNSLTFDEESGYSVQVESKTNENDPIVKDLRNTFFEWQQENSKKILTNVAKYGCWGLRPYFTDDMKSIDLNKTLTGPECHPSTFRIFESLGEYAGVYSEFQHPQKLPQLLEAWQFIVFKAPGNSFKTGLRPRRIHPEDPNYIFDILDDAPPPTLSEAWDYGRSIFYRAYSPWKALEEAELALLIARLKSAQRETLIAYPIGNQDPIESASMINTLTEMLQSRDDADNKRSLREGLVQVARKLILPYDGSGKGQLSFSQSEGNINIDGIQDIMLFVKVLCGSLGTDPALHGFSDMMAGGLGEGGWLRTSILSTAIGIALRQSLRNGFERLYEIHVKLKWGKIFTPNQKPWRTKFHAVSDAKEREAMDTRLQKMDFAERFINLFLSFEGEMPMDKEPLKNVLLTYFLDLEEPIVRELSKQPNGKSIPKMEEKADNFKNMTVNERVDFIEEAITPYLEVMNGR